MVDSYQGLCTLSANAPWSMDMELILVPSVMNSVSNRFFLFKILEQSSRSFLKARWQISSSSPSMCWFGCLLMKVALPVCYFIVSALEILGFSEGYFTFTGFILNISSKLYLNDLAIPIFDPSGTKSATKFGFGVLPMDIKNCLLKP